MGGAIQAERNGNSKGCNGMNKTITSLTQSQADRLAEWREKWLAIGLSTDPADREGAQQGVIAAYAAANLAKPTVFVWLRSPLEGAYASAILSKLMAQVGAQVGGQVWDQVGGQVWDQVRGQVWDQVGDQVNYACWGPHDAGWLGWADYFRVVVSLASAEKAAGLIRVAQCCGWWWPKEGAVILTERPNRLHRDSSNRLHSSDGLAIGYPDGWGIYAWHGIRVPERVIMRPQEITCQEIMAEQNAEVRRVMIERYGFDRFIVDSKAKVLNRVGEYELVSVPDPAEGSIKALKMVCPSTSAVYVHPVAPECETVEAALAWKRGESLDQKYFDNLIAEA
jgi:hypothetical protein